MRALFLSLSASLAMAAAGPVQAAASRAVLEADPPHRILVFDGRVWACDQRVCSARGLGRSQSLARECARAARRLGRFVSYSRNDALTPEQLKTCNAARRR